MEVGRGALLHLWFRATLGVDDSPLLLVMDLPEGLKPAAFMTD